MRTPQFLALIPALILALAPVSSAARTFTGGLGGTVTHWDTALD